MLLDKNVGGAVHGAGRTIIAEQASGERYKP
jgi:hypothetical protein